MREFKNCGSINNGLLIILIYYNTINRLLIVVGNTYARVIGVRVRSVAMLNRENSEQEKRVVFAGFK